LVLQQRASALFIGQRRVEPQHRTHDLPERVQRMAVILLPAQRGRAGLLPSTSTRASVRATGGKPYNNGATAAVDDRRPAMIE